VKRILFALPVVLGACAMPSERIAREDAPIMTEDDGTDPVEHLRYIAGPETEGRGTPSPGLQKAADYVIASCQRAGLVGALEGGAFLQPFTIGGLPVPGPTIEEEDPDFGSELFEDGLFLSGSITPETSAEMGHKLCEALAASGEACPPGVLDGSVDPRPYVQTAAPPQVTNNVVGILPGHGPHKDEIVLLSAHLDHLGKKPTGVFPGADDNASGSSTLLAIMNRVARGAPLDRTLVFFWTAGEEKGLLGASYFVDNPPASVPLARIKQVINMDMVGAWDDTRFSVGVDTGAASQTTAALFDEANAELERPFVRMNRDIQQYNRRQDGYAFSRRQISTIFVFEGLANAAGGGALMARYHKMTDTVDALLAEGGASKLRRMADILSRVVTKVAGSNSP
jgi:aminopeptidase YwaD